VARSIRDLTGCGLVVVALAVVFHGVTQLGARDYLATIVLILTGLSLMRAGVELLRPAIGE